MTIFLPIKDIKWIDQLAHAIIGAILVWATLCTFGVYSIVFSMAIALVREQLQHFGRMHSGSRTDLTFWLLGSVLSFLII